MFWTPEADTADWLSRQTGTLFADGMTGDGTPQVHANRRVSWGDFRGAKQPS